eukprot:1406448-Prymnesium_polylepis.1
MDGGPSQPRAVRLVGACARGVTRILLGDLVRSGRVGRRPTRELTCASGQSHRRFSPLTARFTVAR